METNTPKSLPTPISIVLPSLSPLTPSSDGVGVATLVPASISPAVPVLPSTVSRTIVTTVLEGETPMDVDNADNSSMYSPVPVYKDAKSRMIVSQMSQIARANNYQAQTSMPARGMFEPIDPVDAQQHPKQIANGKRLNNSHSLLSSPIGQSAKRNKHEYRQEFSTSIQVEATATSTPYPHFSDIAWSNCHPEPLAVSRWLRITSNRKQYNFNIH